MTEPRLAEVEVCDDRSCQSTHMMVRGDHLSFVSVEQARRVGDYPLDDRKMPSDIKLPPSYVLVHDTSGVIFSRCELYIVRWFSGNDGIAVDKRVANTARAYFGTDDVNIGSIEIPSGPWQRMAKMKYIRYRRQGHLQDNYEHPYDPPVYLYSTKSGPKAWKLSLPNGCIVDHRGFVKP